MKFSERSSILFNQIIQIEQTKYIDTLLFDLYNLTTEERKVIGYVEIK